MIDLNKQRAARREGKGEAPVVVIGDGNFTLPVEMPFETVEAIARVQVAQETGNTTAMHMAILDTLRVLFGPQYDAFMATQPSVEDLSALMDGVLAEYGMSDPEPDASDGS